jgi:hypothetical protein
MEVQWTQLTLLMDEDIGPCRIGDRTANLWRLKLYRKHNTKYEIVAKIKHNNRRPNYGVMTLYNIMGICRFPESVGNGDRWPIYKGGKLHRFYCTYSLGLLGFFERNC